MEPGWRAESPSSSETDAIAAVTRMQQRSIKGFPPYGIDIVLKFGGSLTRDLRSCRELVAAIAELGRRGIGILIVPGGGRTDKVIEAIDQEQALASDTAHRACALAQDQTGLILCDPSFSRDLIACEKLGKCRAVLARQRIPVLLPSRLLFDLDPVERSWAVTSDAVAAWVAWLVGAGRFAVLTDVDGVYREGHVGDPAWLLDHIGFEALRRMGHTSIDACAADFIATHRIDAAVINGLHPERVTAWCMGERTTATIIGEATAIGAEICATVA